MIIHWKMHPLVNVYIAMENHHSMFQFAKCKRLPEGSFRFLPRQMVISWDFSWDFIRKNVVFHVCVSMNQWFHGENRRICIDLHCQRWGVTIKYEYLTYEKKHAINDGDSTRKTVAKTDENRCLKPLNPILCFTISKSHIHLPLQYPVSTVI